MGPARDPLTAKLSEAGGPEHPNMRAMCSARIRSSDLLAILHQYNLPFPPGLSMPYCSRSAIGVFGHETGRVMTWRATGISRARLRNGILSTWAYVFPSSFLYRMTLSWR